MQKVATSPLMTWQEEWRAPVISGALLTFLALTPLISHRTVRLASQATLFAGMAVHIYTDGKRPFFLGQMNLIAGCPRLYGTGASKPLELITDAHGGVVGREPMERLFMASFEGMKSRRTWYGMERPLPHTSSFDLPFTLMSRAIADKQLLFRYSGLLVQVVPTEESQETFNKLSNRFRLPAQGDIPEGWAHFSSKESDYLLSTDPRGWALAEGWTLLTTNPEGKPLVDVLDQTVPEFFRPYLTARAPVSVSVNRLNYKPFRNNVKKELSLGPERVEILQYGDRFFLLSEKEGKAHCRILTLERGVSTQDLRFLGQTVKVVDSRPVKGPDGSSVTLDRESWTLTNGWQSLQIGEDGRLVPAPEQTLPQYFRDNLLSLRFPSNPMPITPNFPAKIGVPGLSPGDRLTTQIVAKGETLHLVPTGHMAGYTSQGAPTTIDHPFHHLILLREGVTLQNLQLTLSSGQISVEMRAN